MSRVQERERFQVQKELGGGAFGVVKLAYDAQFDRLVAIKVPRDPAKQQALIKDLQLMDRVRDLVNPHLVMLRESAEFEGKTVLVMEYVEGCSLRDMIGEIGQGRPLDVEMAINMAMQVCEGLYALHNAGIIDGQSGQRIFHRDIKPENILIRQSDGLVKIADFGIATILESSGLAWSNTGTLPYMSPELLDRMGADYRADIYGLGVTLYEMLTGLLPFPFYDDNGQPKPLRVYIDEICQGHPPAPADIANVDKELSDIVLKAMYCEVNHRYQSAQELRTVLEEFHARLLVDNIIADAWQKEDPTAREQALKEVVQCFPRSPKGYRNLAWFYNRQRRFTEAVTILEEGRALCPRCGELVMDLALAYRQVGQGSRAIDMLEEASRLDLPREKQPQARLLLNLWRKEAGRPCT